MVRVTKGAVAQSHPPVLNTFTLSSVSPSARRSSFHHNPRFRANPDTSRSQFEMFVATAPFPRAVTRVNRALLRMRTPPNRKPAKRECVCNFLS